MVEMTPSQKEAVEKAFLTAFNSLSYDELMTIVKNAYKDMENKNG